MSNRSENVMIRVRPTEKAIVERAARSVGLSLSGYVRQAMLRDARRDLEPIASIRSGNIDDMGRMDALLSDNGRGQ